MKTLFLSYRHTLIALLRGKKNGGVAEGDLATGLFYFRSARDHVLSGDGSAAMEFARSDAGAQTPEVVRKIFGQLQDALFVAEADGRVSWRPSDVPSNSYAVVADLLKRNGGPLVELPDDTTNAYSPYEVAKLVRDQCSTLLQVIPYPKE